MTKKKLTKKQIRTLHRYVRGVIQLIFFLFFPSVFTAAFAGIKYLFTQMGAGNYIEVSSFVTVLLVICGYTIIFGRFFCGFACAFGSFGDAVRAAYTAICKKLKKKPITLKPSLTKWLSYIKYLILLIIVIACFAGVYGKAQGTSPWDVFSMLHARNFKLGNYVPGIVILVLIVVGMCFQERFFCRFLCPMGAVFSLLPMLPFYTLQRDRESCIKNCSACTKTCPSNVELPSSGSVEVSGDCFQCQKCIDICPKSNVHCGIGILKGNEIIFTIIRAGVLLGLYLWLDI